MTNITLYGQHTSTYEYLKMMLKKKFEKAGIEVVINEVNDWKKILDEKIESLPAIKFNNHESLYYNNSRGTNEFINEVTARILKEEDYGKMLKILVPTDFSEASTNALVYGYNLGRDLNGIIKLIHVYKPAVTQVDSVVIVDEEVEKVKRKQLEDFVDKINQSWVGATSDFMPIEGEFILGFVADEVRNMCRESLGRQLVVVGSTGASDPVKKIFGSVTTMLAKNCPAPVLIIPPDASYKGIKNILYAIDNIILDLDSCKEVLRIAKDLNARVHLVHINNSEENYPESQIKDACNRIQPDIEVIYKEIESKDVAEALSVYAQSSDIDLISLTSASRGFLGDLFHKSVTRRLAIHTDIPLLVIHTS